MKELVKEAGLENTSFMGSVLDRDLLQSLYTRADLFCFLRCMIMRRCDQEAAAAKCPAVVVAGSNSAENY